MRKFLAVWVGQILSVISNGIVGFGLGVISYQQSNSTLAYSMVVLCAIFPGMIVRFFSGALIDKYNRKILMIIGGSGSISGSIFIFIIILMGKIELWHILFSVSISSAFSGIQIPADLSVISQIIPEKFYSKASGFIQISNSCQMLLSPIIAGSLLGIIGIKGLILIAFVTYILAISLLIFTKIPPLQKGKENKESLFKEITFGFKYFTTKFELSYLIVISSILNFFTGFLMVLIAPMVLTIADPGLYGLGNSLSAFGMIISSIIITTLGIPKKTIVWFFNSILLIGISLIILGFGREFWPIVIPCFLFFIVLPLQNGIIDYSIRTRIDPQLQGRIYAISGMISQIGLIASFLLAGYLADYVFNPMLVEGGVLANSVGKIIGTGPTRGIAFMFLISGILIILLGVTGKFYIRQSQAQKV